MKILLMFGILNPVRVKSRAFHRLQARLFRLNGVQVISVRGFAKSTRTIPIEYGDDVSVIFTEYPDAEQRHDVERIFFEINRRYSTSMAPVVICRTTRGSTPGG